MREVAVVGIGQTKVEEHWNKSLKELAGQAALSALHNANLKSAEAIFIGNMMSGSANHQLHLGAYLGDWIGSRYSESLRVEAACGSGAAAFRSAFLAVASNEVDVALAVGVEKMTDSPPEEITAELATAADADWEADQGVSFVAINAMAMRKYMHMYKWDKNDFAGFSVNAHANGVHNPFARFSNPITPEQYHKAAMICDPINLLDSSPMGDGAAAAVLVPAGLARKIQSHPTVIVSGSAAATDTIGFHSRKDPLWLLAAELSSRKAFSQAGVSPKDIDLFEAHDAFTIMAALSIESSGFCERGKSLLLALDNQINPTGKLPISTFGGLKARGHPVGATGLYQIIEVVQQLRGEAGITQVPGAKIGMAQNIGGSGSNIFTHILSIRSI